MFTNSRNNMLKNRKNEFTLQVNLSDKCHHKGFEFCISYLDKTVCQNVKGYITFLGICICHTIYQQL